MIKVLDSVDHNMIYSLLDDAKKDCMLDGSPDQIANVILMYQKLGTILCVVDGDSTICVAGITRSHKGVGICWSIIGNSFLKKPILLVKTSRNFIKKSMDKMNLHRIHMDIDKSYKENMRFASSLGFSCESTMYKYGPQRQDYYKYVLLRD